MRRLFLANVFILLSVYLYANCSKVETKFNRHAEQAVVSESYDVNKLIQSIIQIESKGNTKAVSKDGNCVGVMQIKKIVVDDCNEFLKMKGKSKRYTYNDRYDKDKSIEMFLLIKERYQNYKKNRSKSDIEHIIRVWNGGCGYTLSKTEEYYQKVINVYRGKI